MESNMEHQVENLEIINPNKNWVIKELDLIFNEWVTWASEVEQIEDHPYDTNTQLDVYAEDSIYMKFPLDHDNKIIYPN